MTITITQLYQALTEKLGKESAETLTNYVEQKVKEETSSYVTKEFLELKFEVMEHKLASKITKTVFWGSLIQFLAIITSLTAIMSFMLSHVK